MKKRPSSNKNLEKEPDVKGGVSKKVKANQEETVKLNLLIDEVVKNRNLAYCI
jgi:hypothetical protein